MQIGEYLCRNRYRLLGGPANLRLEQIQQMLRSRLSQISVSSTWKALQVPQTNSRLIYIINKADNATGENETLLGLVRMLLAFVLKDALILGGTISSFFEDKNSYLSQDGSSYPSRGHKYILSGRV
jgi:hypothetical protein